MSSSALRPGARVHLVGVGGAGMSALARILLERGHPVSGSDLRGGRVCNELAAMGATIFVGHDAAQVADADVVALSSAVPEHNVEWQAASARGVPVWRRAQLLAALMAERTTLLIAGTHGKTTTTSMLTVCLQQAGLDPSFAIGGTLNESGTSAHHGSGEHFVAEADESDRSFLTYRADLAVVTNVELDHHDAYSSLAETLEVFVEFLSQRRTQGLAVIGVDDAGGQQLAAQTPAPLVTYGSSDQAMVQIVDVKTSPHGSQFWLRSNDQRSGPFGLRVPGMHNVQNATAAIIAARWAGADDETIAVALHSFSGAQRRFQRLGERNNVQVIDDYAHHPTEISATLQAARQAFPQARLVAAFQPHRYSRTAVLGAEFGKALSAADVVVVTGVYGAGEAPIPGIDGALVAEAARVAGAATQEVAAAGDLPELLATLVQPGDVVLTLGAGDITEVGPALLRRLEGGT